MKKRKFDEETLPPSYEGIERQLMALFYSGVYVTNDDIIKVGRRIGLELPRKDRMALLKEVMHEAYENGQMVPVLQGFIQLLQERANQYRHYAQQFPAAAPLIGEWLQKVRATTMLLQREMRSDPYA